MSWTLERIVVPTKTVDRELGRRFEHPTEEVEVLTFLNNNHRTNWNCVLVPKGQDSFYWTKIENWLREEMLALIEPEEHGSSIIQIARYSLPVRLPKRLPKDPHKRDLAVVAYALRDEAHARGWCDEFEAFVKRVNPLLSSPLTARGGKK